MLTVWLPMCSTVAPLARGELEGTSLAMAQGKASPVLVVAPIFRVPTVLRSGAVGVPPTARGACDGRLYGPPDESWVIRFTLCIE